MAVLASQFEPERSLPHSTITSAFCSPRRGGAGFLKGRRVVTQVALRGCGFFEGFGKIVILG